MFVRFRRLIKKASTTIEYGVVAAGIGLFSSPPPTYRENVSISASPLKVGLRKEAA